MLPPEEKVLASERKKRPTPTQQGKVGWEEGASLRKAVCIRSAIGGTLVEHWWKSLFCQRHQECHKKKLYGRPVSSHSPHWQDGCCVWPILLFHGGCSLLLDAATPGSLVLHPLTENLKLTSLVHHAPLYNGNGQSSALQMQGTEISPTEKNCGFYFCPPMNSPSLNINPTTQHLPHERTLTWANIYLYK